MGEDYTGKSGCLILKKLILYRNEHLTIKSSGQSTALLRSAAATNTSQFSAISTHRVKFSRKKPSLKRETLWKRPFWSEPPSETRKCRCEISRRSGSPNLTVKRRGAYN
jgi:hypothetical protein